MFSGWVLRIRPHRAMYRIRAVMGKKVVGHRTPPFLEMVAILSQTGAACKPETAGEGVFSVCRPGHRLLY